MTEVKEISGSCCCEVEALFKLMSLLHGSGHFELWFDLQAGV